MKETAATLPEIKLPDGYKPEQDGDTGEVQALVRLKLKGDGTAELISIDGAAFDGKPEVDEADEAANATDESDSPDVQSTEAAAEAEPSSFADKIKKIRTSMK